LHKFVKLCLVSLDISNIVFSVVYGFYHAIANYSTGLGFNVLDTLQFISGGRV